LPVSGCGSNASVGVASNPLLARAPRRSRSRPAPGPDHIVKIGKSILTAKPSDKLDFTFYEVPTRQTNRIIQGPDRNMWFTELKSDRVGKVQTGE